jgi:hypothetical protein
MARLGERGDTRRKRFVSSKFYPTEDESERKRMENALVLGPVPRAPQSNIPSTQIHPIESWSRAASDVLAAFEKRNVLASEKKKAEEATRQALDDQKTLINILLGDGASSPVSNQVKISAIPLPDISTPTPLDEDVNNLASRADEPPSPEFLAWKEQVRAGADEPPSPEFLAWKEQVRAGAESTGGMTDALTEVPPSIAQKKVYDRTRGFGAAEADQQAMQEALTRGSVDGNEHLRNLMDRAENESPGVKELIYNKVFSDLTASPVDERSKTEINLDLLSDLEEERIRLISEGASEEEITAVTKRLINLKRLLDIEDVEKEKVGDPAVDKYTDELAKQLVPIHIKNYDLAKEAVVTNVDIKDLISQLTGPNADEITGLLANLKLYANKAMAMLGNAEARGAVVDAETLDAAMGAGVFKLLKILGIGARGLDTPAEVNFLRSVMTGTLSQNRMTLLNMALGRAVKQNSIIKRWNNDLTSPELAAWVSSRPSRAGSPLHVESFLPPNISEESFEKELKKRGISRLQGMREIWDVFLNRYLTGEKRAGEKL